MTTQAADVRQQLIDAGSLVMVTRGYSAVSLADIVGQAGVPKGSFYYYFKTKEDFGQAMLEDYFANYNVKADRLLAGSGSPKSRLLAYFKNWAATQSSDNLADRCLATKLGAEVSDLSESMRMVLDRGTKVNVARLASCIAAGQEDGSVQSSLPPAVLAQSLYELWTGASLIARLDHQGAPFDSAFALTEKLI